MSGTPDKGSGDHSAGRNAETILPAPPRWRPASAGRLMLAAALFARAVLAGAQEAGDEGFDPFAEGAFEAETGAAVSSAGESAPSGSGVAKTEFLAGGSLTVAATTYAAADFGGYSAFSYLSGKLFAKVNVPDYGALFAAYVVSQDFFAGRSGTGAGSLTYGADLESPTYALAELHYSFDLGKRLFVRLGKQLLAWGPSRVWTPVDFVNPDKADFFSSVDLREGKAGLRLHIPLSKANLFFFSDFSGLVDDTGAVLDPATAVNYAARVDATLAGFELGLTGFWGPEAQAKGGFDFSGSLLSFSVYGELAAGFAYSDYESFATASLGLSRALGDLKKWTISAEGFFNSAGTGQTGAELLDALRNGTVEYLYVGRWYAYAAIAGTDFPGADVDSTLYVLANCTDGSFQATLSESFSIARLVPFTVALSYLGGRAGTELTSFSDGPAFQLSVRTKISF